MDCKICSLARLACGHTQSVVIYFGGYSAKSLQSLKRSAAFPRESLFVLKYQIWFLLGFFFFTYVNFVYVAPCDVVVVAQ